MKLYEDLLYRGLIKDISSEKLEEKLNQGGLTFYIGTDPTADSMHIGHFSSFLIATRLKRAGHHPILLVGGGTGLIGDPKPNAEREIKSYEEIQSNVKALSLQASKIFECDKVVNNYDWYKDINFVDYLRDFGKYFSINYMLDKDIIKRRLDVGITYTEFSYMIMQALDFWYLFKNNNCLLQVAGSDQWGNITAGIDLIRKKEGEEAFGFTMPLITDSNGQKFGKTEGNALWLDEKKTSSYEFYQYLINVEDVMVIDYLKKLTFLTKEEIEEIEKEHMSEPHKRIAHKKLAEEVITFLHGEDSYKNAVNISEALFSGDVKNLSDQNIEDAFKNFDFYDLDEDKTFIELLVDNKICSSKREARELLEANAIRLNGDIINDEDYMIDNKRKYNIIRKGKKKYFVFKK